MINQSMRKNIKMILFKIYYKKQKDINKLKKIFNSPKKKFKK